jgi:hypothetical protein
VWAKAPQNWPGLDLIAPSRPDGRIQVKGRRAGTGRSCSHWDYDPKGDWDWLALIKVNVDNGKCNCYFLPRAYVEMLDADGVTFPSGEGKRRIQCNTIGLEAFATTLT